MFSSLFANLSVVVPVYRFHNTPICGRMADALSVHVEGNPHKEDCGADARHGAERPGVAGLSNPRVSVEREEESESSCLLFVSIGRILR